MFQDSTATGQESAVCFAIVGENCCVPLQVYNCCVCFFNLLAKLITFMTFAAINSLISENDTIDILPETFKKTIYKYPVDELL